PHRRHHPHQPARDLLLAPGRPVHHRHLLRRHPRTRMGRQRLLGRHHSPHRPRRRLARRRRRHPPPHPGRLPLRRANHPTRRLRTRHPPPRPPPGRHHPRGGRHTPTAGPGGLTKLHQASTATGPTQP